MPPRKKFSSGRRTKAQNGDQNLIYPPLTLLTTKIFPLKRVSKNIRRTVWELLNPKVPRFCRFTGVKKDAIDLTSRWKVRFRHIFSTQNEVLKKCFISWCWSHTLLIILVGFTPLQTSGLFICPDNNSLILPKINLKHLELLRLWGPQIQLIGVPRH